MKNWTLPVAVARSFAANDYVAACYQIKCIGPNDNAYNSDLLAADGTSVANPPYEGARFKGCGGYHTVTGDAAPTSPNGVVIQDGQEYPVFYWFGDVLDITEAGDLADFHFTDLGVADAVIPAENPNHS